MAQFVSLLSVGSMIMAMESYRICIHMLCGSVPYHYRLYRLQTMWTICFFPVLFVYEYLNFVLTIQTADMRWSFRPSSLFRMPDLDQQKQALNAFLGAGNSVMDRMRVDGVNVDENGDAGLDVQSAIFKRFQAGGPKSMLRQSIS